MDEIKRSDTRQVGLATGRGTQEADLQKARTSLARAEAELRRTKALLAEAVRDWRAERERRRTLEERLEGTQHGVVQPGRPRGQP